MARTLEVVILGDSSSVEKAFAKSAAAAESFSGKVSAAGAKTAAVGKTLTTHLTLPIVAVGALSTKAAIDFQSAMELIHTQAGLPQAAVDGLKKSVLGLAGPTATAPDILAAGLYHLTSQGLRGAKSMEALKVAAEGAKMGQADLEDVTNALGAVIASNIKGVKNYGQAMGEMNAIVGSGDMRMQDLADAFGTGLAAKAAVAGVSLRDVGAALATLGDNNIRGAKAGTQLASAMRLMEGPSNAAAKAMKAFGINSHALGETLSTKGLVPALEMLQDKLKGLDTAAKTQALTRMFGGKQAGAVLVLIDQLGRLKMKEKEVEQGGAEFAKNWADYTKTTAYHMASMGAAMQASGITIGEILLPIVSQLVNAIGKLATKFEGLPDGVKKAILIFAGVAAAIGPVLSVIGSLTTALTFLAANPLVLVIAGVAALVAALVAAVVWPDKLRDVLEKMGLSASASGKIVDGLRAVFTRVMQAGYSLLGAILAHWSTISATISGAVDIITTVVRTFVSVTKALWGEFGSFLITAMRNAWQLVQATVRNGLTVLRGVIDVIAGLIHGDWGRVWQGIKEITGGVLSEIKALVVYFLREIENAMGAVGKVLGQIGGKIKAVFAGAGSWLVGAGKKIIEGLISGMESLAGQAGTKAAAVGKKIKDAFTGAGTWLFSEGKAIMQGLLNGLESLAPTVESWVEAKAAHLKHLLTHPWEIGSPSKVTTELGEQIMAGLAVGFENASAATDAALVRAMSGLAPTMVSTLDAAIAQVSDAATGGFAKMGKRLGKSLVDAMASEISADVPRLRDALQQETITLPGKAKQINLPPPVKTTYKSTTGAPISDDYIQAAIQASLAANPNAAGGNYNLATGAGSTFSYQGPPITKQYNVNIDTVKAADPADIPRYLKQMELISGQ